jgi:hypothetical protein
MEIEDVQGILPRESIAGDLIKLVKKNFFVSVSVYNIQHHTERLAFQRSWSTNEKKFVFAFL